MAGQMQLPPAGHALMPSGLIVPQAYAGGYNGASHTRKAFRGWGASASQKSADQLAATNLRTLRNRSRDLARNSPLAGGAINTNVTSVIGAGLKFQARINHEALGISREAADAWERNAERRWKLWAVSKDCDIARTVNFYESQALVHRARKEGGDVLAVLLRMDDGRLENPLRLQFIEAERLCNPNHGADTDEMAQGVEKDQYGAPVAYQILNGHPGTISKKSRKWTRVEAFGENGRRNVIHHYRQKRPGQTRGTPYLSTVIEALKQLGDYTEGELAAAVISGMNVTYHVNELGEVAAEMAGNDGLEGYVEQRNGFYQSSHVAETAYGRQIGLFPGDKIESPTPGRPNSAFDPFVLAILRQVGVELQLPFELLIKHFTASYSAARAALEEAWRYFRAEREWETWGYSVPVYETWLDEEVAAGRIHAPGYFTDPLIRQAWSGSEWIGPSKPQIDPLKEMRSREIAEQRGWITAAQNTAELNGGDWDTNHARRVREEQMRREAQMFIPQYEPQPLDFQEQS